MRLYVDVETEWLQHCDAVPKFVVGGYAYDDEPVEFTYDIAQLRRRMLDPAVDLVMHRGAFETLTLGIAGRRVFFDTAMVATIAGAERGDPDAAGHSLKDLAKRAGYQHPGGKGVKGLQASFKQGARMSPEQEAYLRADVEATRAVHLWQLERYPSVPDLERQTRWSEEVIALGRRGLHIDPVRVDSLLVEAHGKLAGYRRQLREAGIIQARGPKKDPWRKSSVDTSTVQELLAAAGCTERTSDDPEAPLTRNSLILRKTNDPRLHLLADFYRAEKWVGLVEAYEVGGDVVRSRYNSLVATGRMSSAAPNVQQVPKKGGIRECWTRSPGSVLVEADYAMLELYTFADTCARWGIPSRLRDALNEGKDVHTIVAAETGISRDLAKVFNYGGMGGMGPATLQANIEKQLGKLFPLEELRAGQQKWLGVWPEIQRYWSHNKINARPAGFVLRPDGTKKQTYRYLVTSPQSGRKRLAYYCAAQNMGFQAPGGDIIKHAIAKCHAAGLHPVAALHDQLLLDEPKADAPEASRLFGKLMKEAGEEICPNVKWPDVKVSVFEERWVSK